MTEHNKSDSCSFFSRCCIILSHYDRLALLNGKPIRPEIDREVSCLCCIYGACSVWGTITLLPEYDITLYVSFIGFTFTSVPSPSPNENKGPKTAFEILLVVVVLSVVAPASPPRLPIVVFVTSVALANWTNNDGAPAITTVPPNAIIVTATISHVTFRRFILCKE